MCCRGNRYDVISALKVLPNNRVAKIFIVCLHYELSFFGIFHRFTKTIATKKTLSSLLNITIYHFITTKTQKLGTVIVRAMDEIVIWWLVVNEAFYFPDKLKIDLHLNRRPYWPV